MTTREEIAHWTATDLEGAKAKIQFNYTPEDWAACTENIMPVFFTAKVNAALTEIRSRESTALEIGCGVGRLLKPMSKIFGSVIGLDVTPRMVELSSEYLGGAENVAVWLNDGRTLYPVRDSAIDFVYSMITFQHIKGRATIHSYLKEARRVLLPGGVARIQTHIGSGEGRGLEDGYLYPSVDAFAEEFENAGLTVAEKEQIGPWLWVTAENL